MLVLDFHFPATKNGAIGLEHPVLAGMTMRALVVLLLREEGL